MVRQRIVYCFHVRVGQQLLVASVGFCNAQRVGDFLGSAPVSGSNGDHLTALAFLHRRDNFLDCNISRAQDSPAHFLRHSRVWAHDKLMPPAAVTSSPAPRNGLRSVKSSCGTERTIELHKTCPAVTSNNADVLRLSIRTVPGGRRFKSFRPDHFFRTNHLQTHKSSSSARFRVGRFAFQIQSSRPRYSPFSYGLSLRLCAVLRHGEPTCPTCLTACTTTDRRTRNRCSPPSIGSRRQRNRNKGPRVRL